MRLLQADVRKAYLPPPTNALDYRRLIIEILTLMSMTKAADATRSKQHTQWDAALQHEISLRRGINRTPD
jgi:hypothetical protein